MVNIRHHTTLHEEEEEMKDEEEAAVPNLGAMVGLQGGIAEQRDQPRIGRRDGRYVDRPTG